MRVQLFFEGLGDQAAAVAAWLEEHYPHLECQCVAQPGLAVTLRLPPANSNGTRSLPGRLLELNQPTDLAFEIISEAFSELGLPAARVVSMHVTES